MHWLGDKSGFYYRFLAMASACCSESIAPDQCSVARSNGIAALRGMYCKQQYFLAIYIHNSPGVRKKLVLFSSYDRPQ